MYRIHIYIPRVRGSIGEAHDQLITIAQFWYWEDVASTQLDANILLHLDHRKVLY